MSDTCNYPAEIERDEDGRYVVAFPDFGWGATDGTTRDEAVAEAKDLLRELIATTIREGGDLPEPSRAGRGRPLVMLVSTHPVVRTPCSRHDAGPGSSSESAGRFTRARLSGD